MTTVNFIHAITFDNLPDAAVHEAVRCCVVTFGIPEAAGSMALVRDYGITADRIAEIDVNGFHEATCLNTNLTNVKKSQSLFGCGSGLTKLKQRVYLFIEMIFRNWELCI
jgi:hypothetical protein